MAEIDHMIMRVSDPGRSSAFMKTCLASHSAATIDRSGSQPQPQYGARGLALACCFEDPDGHNLEIRY